MLTHEHIAILRAPFAPEQHEFHRGFAYIRELDVCRRLETVDPGYEFRLGVSSMREVVPGFNQVVQYASLTVSGVTRESCGMAAVELTKDGNREAGEAEKAAVTDALRRCARLFGVGQYLLNTPKDVKTEAQLAKWLAGMTNITNTPRPAQTEQGTWVSQDAIARLKSAVGIDDYATLCQVAGIGTTGKDSAQEWAARYPTYQDALAAIRANQGEDIPF